MWVLGWVLGACETTGSGEAGWRSGGTLETRGGKVVYEAPNGGNQGLQGEEVLYEKSYAVVIGIDRYSHIDPLNGAVKDAQEVARVLQEEHGMEVYVLLDDEANRRNIADVISSKLRAQVGKNDRVLIYYAGHGTTLGSDGNAMGYLLPVDGEMSSPGGTGISMDEMQRWLQSYPSKHIMFVADACYSGLAVPPATTRGASIRDLPDYMKKVAGLPVRMTMVAGSSDEQVIDNFQGHGLFTYYFLAALKGDADVNGDGLITSDELATYIKPAVAQTASSEFHRPQNPQVGRAGEGEFIFVSPRPATGPTVRCPPGMEFKMGEGCVPLIKQECPVGMSFVSGQGCVGAQSGDPGPSKAAPSAPGGKIEVPAGWFVMGASGMNPDEGPERRVHLDAFQMDRYEITVEDYARCVRAGGCTEPEVQHDSENPTYNWGASGRERHPINGVNWFQAASYCEWAQGRLPTEAEWEKAARGADGRFYPWGNQQPDCSRVVMSGCGSFGSQPVGTRKPGTSPYGIFDMAGNVAEWVEDVYDPKFYGWMPDNNPANVDRDSQSERVTRGGSFGYAGDSLVATARIPGIPDSASEDVGFRCAY
jgi:formylglycine-generating enzyme required for sulfatase activity